MSWSVKVNGKHSSPYNSMDSTADRQRPILIESFALELNIKRSLVATAHALDKRDRKTVSNLSNPIQSNLVVYDKGHESLGQLEIYNLFYTRWSMGLAKDFLSRIILSRY